jgi:hypothetical protein CLOST_0741
MMDSDLHVNDDDRKKAVREQLSTTQFHLASTEQPADVTNAIKIPLDYLSSLGVAFGPIPTMFRSITTTINIPTLLTVTDKLGNPLDPNILQTFKDGSGLLGSFRDAATGFGQARFHVQQGMSLTSVTTMPYNPAFLAMAIALVQINKKLDSIQSSVDQIFKYMRQRDKADMQGNLKTLADILNEYGFNYGNTVYMSNAHMKVLDIKQKSEQDMELFRFQVQEKLHKKSFIEIRESVSKRLDTVLDYLKDYQLSAYIYCFALFLEPMLSENFESGKLNAITKRIEEESIRYLELYSECYEVLETSTHKSIDTIVFGGLASVGQKAGKAIASTKVGDHTLIDEALEGAGKGIEGFNDKYSNSLTEKLLSAKGLDVIPFKENVENINVLYNQPSQLAIDDKNIYVLPC